MRPALVAALKLLTLPLVCGAMSYASFIVSPWLSGFLCAVAIWEWLEAIGSAFLDCLRKSETT